MKHANNALHFKHNAVFNVERAEEVSVVSSQHNPLVVGNTDNLATTTMFLDSHFPWDSCSYLPVGRSLDGLDLHKGNAELRFEDGDS